MALWAAVGLMVKRQRFDTSVDAKGCCGRVGRGAR